MTDIFEMILNLSLTGSVVILLVIAARIPLRRISRKYAYWLWSLVVIKLVCPVSGWSLISRIKEMFSGSAAAGEVAGNAVKASSAVAEAAAEINAPVIMQNVETAATQAAASAHTPVAEHIAVQSEGPMTISSDIAQILTAVWIAGAVILLLFAVIKAVQTARDLRGAEHVSDNIYRSYKVSSPFVFGIIRPRIYMPTILSPKDYSFLLRHEQTHIRRHDLVFKGIWIVLLSINWFNPFIWVAFRLFERDMEMSCDEEVIKLINRELRADYCSSLVNYARLSNRPKAVIMPINFGKKDVKARIENIMKYRQISKKASAAAIVTFALAATGCLISPDQKEVNVETSATSATTVETTAETTAETSAEKNSESKDIAKEGKKKVKKDVSKPAPKAEESDPADENTDVEAPSTDAAATPVSETQMTDELMGYKEWTIKEYAVEWGDQYHNYEFYANDGTMLGYYGGAKNDFGIKDIDGDGISELICNNEYSGDGAKTAIVFRNNNGKIEMAEANDFDYITKVTHNSELMATSFDTYFDSESGNLKLFDKANNRTLPYDYSALIFVPLNNY